MNKEKGVDGESHICSPPAGVKAEGADLTLSFFPQHSPSSVFFWLP